MREPQEAKPPAARGKAKETRIKLGRDGRLTLPREIAKKLGAEPGAALDIVLDGGRVEILPDIHSLSRLYIEPTSRCNLACRTCIRNTWAETPGDMAWDTFRRLVRQLAPFRHLESVMFGGFGEPLAHPDILRMIAAVARRGLRAEITTNGTLLDEAMIRGLIESRLNTLWVSLDGARETSYEDIRAGASFKQVVAGLQRLQALQETSGRKIRVGIAFVVMRRNVRDLKTMDELARSVGADVVTVSHILPYQPEMEEEMLCRLTLSLDTFAAVPEKTVIHLPRLDINALTQDTVLRLLQGFENLTLMGNKIAAATRWCRFIRERCAFVRWDGQAAPCLGLLHAHKTYLYGTERMISPYPLGDIRRTPLSRIWNSREYRDFREKVKAFDYSPCHLCGGCDLLKENKEDCFGNAFPVCGGCLWAQGIIQCP